MLLNIRSLLSTSVALFAFAACEDGPPQLFSPNTGDPPVQNGFKPAAPWQQDGSKSYEETAGRGDSVARARFCDEQQSQDVVAEMVMAPIVPDVSAGKLPLWSEGKPTFADDLIGLPADGKFCDPPGVYANAYTYGPLDELIFFFNEQTRLVEGIQMTQGYLGALEGDYTTAAGTKEHIFIRPRDRAKFGTSRELDQYSSRADQARRTNSWLNHANITAMYQMVRETFFEGRPAAMGYDCVTAGVCDVIYTGDDDSVPQNVHLVIRDSGTQIGFRPDGSVWYVYIEPVRVAPFEARTTLAFDNAMGAGISPRFNSVTRASCQFSMAEAITWGTFKSRCVEQGDTRTLARVNYEVETQRDASIVHFNGMDLSFLRKTSTKGVFRDGQSPADDDAMYSLTFTRTLLHTVDEFRPATLAASYKTKLEARLRDSIIASGPGTSTATHPLAQYRVTVPADLSTEPQRIGELTYMSAAGPASWVSSVLTEVETVYENLAPEEKAVVDPRVNQPVYLLEPFVDAVLEAFSRGATNGARAFKGFRTTDDRRWSIGISHFVQDNVPFRMIVQYSLNFGAITAVTVERGNSEVDEIFENVNRFAGERTMDRQPFYTIARARDFEGNPFGLGGEAITVTGFDRQLGTVSVDVRGIYFDGSRYTTKLVVPGESITDRSGFLRQIRGQRYEFVPSHLVQLLGKETSMNFYVGAAGQIERVSQGTFKGELELCDGLPLHYGDDVRRTLDAWVKREGPDGYRDCEVVFNYSANGNVLDEVVSLTRRVGVVVLDGRASTAFVWR